MSRIADLGGLKLSFAALQSSESKGTTSHGFSPEQQFFYGYAQAWCTNVRPEFLRTLVQTNPHSPPRFRVNGPLSNLPEFARAFSCEPTSKMVRKNRCEVW